MSKIMVIDDDQDILDLLEQFAVQYGYEFAGAKDGTAGLERIAAEDPDLIILDVMIPSINGFELCRRIRETDIKTPIIILSAKGDIVDKSVGFDVGADDYLVKPFSIEELSLRVKSHLRRQRNLTQGPWDNAGSQAIVIGNLELLPASYEARLNGAPVALSSKEFELMILLASSPGEVFTREQIIRHLWGSSDCADPSSVTVYIRRIREKIEADPAHPRYLLTVWRVGYKLAHGQ
ncbi:MAG: response regulator transcription factor [Eggerthellaceae bacterium]|nr:response regulator transcription factor [Eggerthellaceae bacterium]